METYTLLELNRLVRRTLEGSFDGEYWVEGELLDARVAGGGHFYAELVQRDAAGDAIVARARINCWARQFAVVHLRFRHETGETLRAGLKVRILVRVTFHEQYGYALNMLDVDGTFTVGDMLLRRRQILARLEADGILSDNRTLPMPRLANRVAVISSETAAGYGDFRDQLLNNAYGLRFDMDLYPTLLQGASVPESIMAAMEAILSSGAGYDVVVIIRGGGATGDLSDFDSYALAACVAQCPVPVIVGIGHDRDRTVLDDVAHTRVKTPTAAAALLVDHQREEAAGLEMLAEGIAQSVQARVEGERQRLSRLTAVLPVAFSRVAETMAHRVETLLRGISVAASGRVEREGHRLSLLSQRIESFDPERMLRLGYSITTREGRLVRDAAALMPGDEITTRLESGTIKSIVK